MVQFVFGSERLLGSFPHKSRKQMFPCILAMPLVGNARGQLLVSHLQLEQCSVPNLQLDVGTSENTGWVAG